MTEFTSHDSWLTDPDENQDNWGSAAADKLTTGVVGSVPDNYGEYSTDTAEHDSDTTENHNAPDRAGITPTPSAGIQSPHIEQYGNTEDGQNYGVVIR